MTEDIAHIAQFRRILKKCWDKSGGKSWEPPTTQNEFFDWAIQEGYVRRADGRFGVERFKDSFVVWTEAGKVALENWNG